MEKYYHFAGMDFLIDIADEKMYRDDRRLTEFRTDTINEPHSYHFRIVDALEPPFGMKSVVLSAFQIYKEGNKIIRYIGVGESSWENAYIRAEHKEKEHYIQLKRSKFPERIGTHTVLDCLMFEHLIAEKRGFILHSSYIEWKGKALLFTAPSGTGKSTQAELWKSYRNAEIINGDRTAVRIAGENVLAEGIPFSGSSVYCKNRTLPIAAIVYLKQAPATTIQKLKKMEAFLRIWEGCSVNAWDKRDINLVSETVQKVIEQIPVYQLACTPDESAVAALEQILGK